MGNYPFLLYLEYLFNSNKSTNIKILFYFPIPYLLSIKSGLLVQINLHTCNSLVYQIEMNTKALSVLLLLVVALCNNLNQVSDRRIIVQANHFFSSYQTSIIYDINSVQRDKSLVFVLTEDSPTAEDLNDNPITVTLISGKITESCIFKNKRNICALNRIEDRNNKLKIECKKTPCELSWTLLQPDSFIEDGLHQIDQLVEINKRLNHATVIASCNDPSLKTFPSDLKLYTNSLYSSIEKEGTVYYLFDNVQTGYYFFTTASEASRKCARFFIRYNPNEIFFNSKDSITEEFIIPSHTRSYAISQMPASDFKMVLSFHTVNNQHITAEEGVTISLMGQDKQKQRKIISQVTVEGQSCKIAMNLSVVFKRPGEEYRHLSIDIASKGADILVLSMNFVASETQEVKLSEVSYFALKKGEKVNYKLLGQEKSYSKKTVISSSDHSKFATSRKQCATKIGCEFTVEALGDGSGSIYLKQTEKKEVERKVFQFEMSVLYKIRDWYGLQSKTIKIKKASQFEVNSPNVIVETIANVKCEADDAECHNAKKPIIDEPKEAPTK